jgi:outer membrane murein-binding lipoprotein Lpp
MVKTTQFVSAVLAAGFILLTGCGKSQKPQAATSVQGVTVDIPKLQAAYETNTAPEIQQQLMQVQFGIRYGDYMKTLMALDKLANNPASTEQQKQVANQVIEQVKQVLNNQQNKQPAPQ